MFRHEMVGFGKDYMAYTMGQKFLVVCRTRQEFQDYMSKLFLELKAKDQPYSTNDFIFVNCVSRIRGMRDLTGVFVGTWYEIPDIHGLILAMWPSVHDITPLRKCLTIIQNRV
jgi:hypothetical protein